MRKLRTSIAALVPMLMVLMLMLASCGKEPLVSPAGASSEAIIVSPKNHGTTSENKPDPQQANLKNTDAGTPDPTTSGDGNGDGISDDGDDLPDSERNRKKK